MRFHRKNRFPVMRESDRKALAFVVLLIVSVTLTLYFSRQHSAVERANNRSGHPVSAVKRGNGGAYGYAQPDVGFGDGSVAASRDGLAARLFPFDPNTADSTTLLRLGLKPWQVRSIYKYRAHGGRFRKPEDFARLYGLTLAQYRRLEPYIRIEPEVMAADVVGRTAERRVEKREPATEQRRSYPEKLTLDDAKVDINTADTALLMRIPGIGPYFARRIVELRQRRKAFVEVDELLAIRNFPETALPYMTASHSFPPLRINSMTLKELQAHPLLNYTQSRDIIALRRTSGPIRSVSDMALLRSFSPDQLSRIAPFIVFE